MHPSRDQIAEAIDSVRKWVPGQDVYRYDVDSGEAADAVLRLWVPEVTG